MFEALTSSELEEAACAVCQPPFTNNHALTAKLMALAIEAQAREKEAA